MKKPRHRTESYWSAEAAKRFSKRGYRVFRNNVGLFTTKDGRRVKTGLKTGSSDRIGWRTYVVQPEDVGRTIAVFVAIEIKVEGEHPTAAQVAFLDAVNRAGGEAWVVTNDVDQPWDGNGEV